jgi:hypothetical protein
MYVYTVYDYLHNFRGPTESAGHRPGFFFHIACTERVCVAQAPPCPPMGVVEGIGWRRAEKKTRAEGITIKG